MHSQDSDLDFDAEQPSYADESARIDDETYKTPGSINIADAEGKVSIEGSTVTISDNGELVGQKIIQKVYTQIRDVIFNSTDQERGKAEEEESFLQVTKKLTLSLSAVPDYLSNDLEPHLNELRSRHLILIGCPNRDFALEAAHALIANLDICSDEHVRSLDIEESAGVDIRSLLPPGENAGVHTAILVNALDEDAPSFFEFYFRDPARSHILHEFLKEHGVFVLALVEPGYIDERRQDPRRNLNFPCWKIPFLQPLLKQHFPEDYLEFERQIRSEQESGKWDKDESILFYQVNALIKNGGLRDALLGEIEPLVPAEEIFEVNDPIQKTVLYVATYFSGLTPLEFCHIVELLLGNRTAVGTTRQFRRNEDGTYEWTQDKDRVALTEIWKDTKDEVMWKWLRETASPTDLMRIIEFSNYAHRNLLRLYLEDKRPFYLKDQHRILLNDGFFFHRSHRVGKNLMRLAVEMATAYPDEYNKDWLIGMTASPKEQAQPGPGVLCSSDSFLKTSNEVQGDRSNFAHSRSAELFRQMLKVGQTKDAVEKCLTELIGLGHHDSVLTLIKRLQLAPEFDVLYWTKQLLDRGNSTIRVQAFNYLYSYVRRTDPTPYETLKNLQGWLPTEERGKESYSQSSRFALRLLIQYCLETFSRFDAREYGVWPTTYPLFAFADIGSAERSLGRLAQWLFCPGMKKALHELSSDSGIKNAIKELRLDQNPNRLVGALIAEWTFILLGPGRAASTTCDVRPDNDYGNGLTKLGAAAAPDFDATALFDVLLRQVASIANGEQRKELVSYWEQLRKDMRVLIISGRCSPEQKTQLEWKHNRIPELVKKFGSL